MADDLLDRLEPGVERFYLMASLAMPLASTVLCDLIGITRPEQGHVMALATQLNASQMGASLEDLERTDQQLKAFLSALIDKRRVEPRQEGLSALVAAEEGGERAQ